MKKFLTTALVSFVLVLVCCSSDAPQPTDEPIAEEEFVFGADLSYVNQIIDRGGVYKAGDTITDPYVVFAEKGATLARFRLWHNPVWTKEVYGDEGTQLYNDLSDVARAIAAARAQGMKILLDFHFSDTWADPGKQFVPAAWKNIRSVAILGDSIYNYTFKTLQHLNGKGLLPEYVQLGNETNCGMLYTGAPQGFPTANVCNDQWSSMGKLINRGIQAVRDVTQSTSIQTKVVLHVADPKNVDWWFTNIKNNGGVIDFDIIGFSYYPLWHPTVPLEAISDYISDFREKFSKNVLILETAYPWTAAGEDSYTNLFGGGSPLTDYPFSEDGQYDLMKKLTIEVKQGKGMGLIYWEPAWISADMKDLWGTGSSWENCTFFNFEGNTIKGIDYMNYEYQ
ncbi:MAG TPA: glycosyl hydrolase 53 family protein [Chryseosolibacter sp.]|nr:glycosyl hydrolase 53 family protein [Chryseosolibacter sp.]